MGKNHKLAHKYFYKSIANKNVKEATRKLGRNTLCHCGSGLKFKKCCA
ncbi:SEC-C metal-binding domain-containing protein [Pseudoalteromonas sp. APC 3691]